MVHQKPPLELVTRKAAGYADAIKDVARRARRMLGRPLVIPQMALEIDHAKYRAKCASCPAAAAPPEEGHSGALWSLPVDFVDTAAVLGVLKGIWLTKPETAVKARARIEAVLDYAKAHGLRTGENPARWRGHLDHLLPKRQAFSCGHHAALPYQDVPAFVTQLREHNSIAAAALEFTILTVGRTGEVLGARWDEIDFADKTWTIPAIRMKSGGQHRVPLSSRAMAILDEQQVAQIRPTQKSEFIFPSEQGGQ
jgi:integrase